MPVVRRLTAVWSIGGFTGGLTLLTELVSDAFENLCKDYELTIRELFVLIALGEFDAMKATDLGARCHLNKTKVSRFGPLSVEARSHQHPAQPIR